MQYDRWMINAKTGSEINIYGFIVNTRSWQFLWFI